MNEENKIVISDSVNTGVDTALAVADEMVEKIPLLGLAWGLSKVLIGKGMKLRQKRALEWVEMVKDNNSFFTERILRDEMFQDGFVFALEKYLIERNEEKRKYCRNIFLGYVISDNKAEFPIEKFLHTLSQINANDILVLCDLDISRVDKNYQIYGDTDKKLSNIYNLINAGILHNDPSPRVGPLIGPFVWISEFGRSFVEYIRVI